MKTTNQIKNNRISILFFLTTIILLPFVSKAQLNLNATGGVAVSGTTMPTTGLNVNTGDINLSSATNSYQINGNKMLWHNNNTLNIFVGAFSGASITSGANNSFTGYGSGNLATTGSYNSAFGTDALFHNSTSGNNSAFGYYALGYATSSSNTAMGYYSGLQTTTGASNTFIGYIAGSSNTTGSNNTCLGYGADANANNYSNSTSLGNGAIITASNKMFFGNTAITSIQGQVAFTTYSDGRFKNNINEDVKGLAFIKKLRPVTYNMDTKKLDDFLIQNMPDSVKAVHKQKMDFEPSTSIVHSGFIAQEVEKAAQDVGFKSSIVSAPNNSNDPYALSYSEIVVPLVKAVQELSKITDSITIVKTLLDSIVKAQNSKITDLQNQISNCCSNVIFEKALINNDVNSNTAGSNVNVSTINGTSISTPVLYQNIPNPFNQSTSIQYAIPTTTQNASIMVFDLTGKLIKTIPIITFGNAAITINGNELSPGMFVYSLLVDGKIIDTKRMILTQ